MPEPHVRIRNVVYLHRLKAPFVESGKSVLGALEYDTERDLLKCHECGEWKRSIGHHLTQGHPGLTARQYRLKHGLRISTALSNEMQRSIRSVQARKQMQRPNNFAKPKTGGHLGNHDKPKVMGVASEKYEYRNETGRCHEQLRADIAALAKTLGHTPTGPELRQAGIHPRSLTHAFGVKSLADVYVLLALPPSLTVKQYSKAEAIDLLISWFASHQRLPRVPDMGRDVLPSYTAFKHMFGSIRTAFMEAGLGAHISPHQARKFATRAA